MTDQMQMLLTAARLREIAREVGGEVAADLEEEARKLVRVPSLRGYALAHINGNIYDNSPANLRLVTLKENRR